MTPQRSVRRVASSRPLLRLAVLLALVVCGLSMTPRSAAAQEHASPAAQGEAGRAASETGGAEAAHEEGVLPTIARLLNFAILVGILVYFLKSPIAAYLASRATQIRQDLVNAREMRSAAEAQLAEVERRLRDLPRELEALKARGAEDLSAEQARITNAVAAERTRLVEHTRREIEMRLRVARRDLMEHAAQLAISIAEQRIRRSITADDQLRLIDRYTSLLGEAR